MTRLALAALLQFTTALALILTLAACHGLPPETPVRLVEGSAVDDSSREETIEGPVVINNRIDAMVDSTYGLGLGDIFPPGRRNTIHVPPGACVVPHGANQYVVASCKSVVGQCLTDLEMGTRVVYAEPCL